MDQKPVIKDNSIYENNIVKELIAEATNPVIIKDSLHLPKINASIYALQEINVSHGLDSYVYLLHDYNEAYILNSDDIFSWGHFLCVNDSFYHFSKENYQCNIPGLIPVENFLNRNKYFAENKINVDELDLIINFDKLLGIRLNDFDEIQKLIENTSLNYTDKIEKLHFDRISQKLMSLYREDATILFYKVGNNILVVSVNPYDRLISNNWIKEIYGRYYYDFIYFYL